MPTGPLSRGRLTILGRILGLLRAIALSLLSRPPLSQDCLIRSVSWPPVRPPGLLACWSPPPILQGRRALVIGDSDRRPLHAHGLSFWRCGPGDTWHSNCTRNSYGCHAFCVYVIRAAPGGGPCTHPRSAILCGVDTTVGGPHQPRINIHQPQHFAAHSADLRGLHAVDPSRFGGDRHRNRNPH